MSPGAPPAPGSVYFAEVRSFSLTNESYISARVCFCLEVSSRSVAMANGIAEPFSGVKFARRYMIGVVTRSAISAPTPRATSPCIRIRRATGLSTCTGWRSI